MRRGRAALRRYQRLIEDLLATLRARGPPAADDTTIAAHLLRIRDPSGQPLTDEQLAPEIGILYLAGVETSAHTVAFVLCALARMRPSCLPSPGWREAGLFRDEGDQHSPTCLSSAVPVTIHAFWACLWLLGVQIFQF